VPVVPSELVMDCFELARDIRSLDLRAAPHDLRELGYEPVRIETAEGKTEYVRLQRTSAERGGKSCESAYSRPSTYSCSTRRADRGGTGCHGGLSRLGVARAAGNACGRARNAEDQ
jgi:hypothetical protein